SCAASPLAARLDAERVGRVALAEPWQSVQVVDLVNAARAAHDVRQLGAVGPKRRGAVAVEFGEPLGRQARAAARIEDAAAEVCEQLFVRLHEAGGRGPGVGRRLALDEAEAGGVSQELRGLDARRAQSLLDRLTRRARDPRDLAGVVAVHEAQDEDAARLRGLLAQARVVADLSQLVLHAYPVARVGGCAQRELRRVVLDDRGRVLAPPPGAAHL